MASESFCQCQSFVPAFMSSGVLIQRPNASPNIGPRYLVFENNLQKIVACELFASVEFNLCCFKVK